MHKTLLFIILFLTSTEIFGQAGQFFDAPFGGGIGYVPAYYIPNLDPINSQLNQIGMPELTTGGFYSSGIAGFLYVGFVKDLRIGGMGFGGSLSTSQNVDNLNKEVVYSLSGGGVTLEYTLPFIKNFGVSAGVIIGAGSMELDFYRNTGGFSWEGIWEELSDPNEPSDSYYGKLQNHYWMITPTLNVDYPIYRFVLLRLGVGYQFAFADEWTADNDKPVTGIPTD